MGVVYQAEDIRLGRPVALKFLPEAMPRDREALERFRREARAASALNHPHICTIHDIDEHEGRPFIVMELLEGQTLRQRIAAEPPRPRRPARRRDPGRRRRSRPPTPGASSTATSSRRTSSSPSAGEAKVLDFGLAKLAAGPPAAGERSDVRADGRRARGTDHGAGPTVGTVAYMSPEQARGEALDARTDLFSFGVVLYEMATGGLPFAGATAGGVFDAILNRQPIPPPRLNPALPDRARPDRRQGAGEGPGAAVPERPRAAGGPRPPEARQRLAAVDRVARSPPTAPGSLRRSRRGRACGDRRARAASSPSLATAPGGAAALPRESRPPAARTLVRVTFEEGLQAQPTWSPDGRFVAYSSNQSGNFDIWVQPLGGGRAVQVTTDPSSDWQPEWSPDGNSLVFRSERDGGGIFVVPALGGRERRLASFGSGRPGRPTARGSSSQSGRRSRFHAGGPGGVRGGWGGWPPDRVLSEASPGLYVGRITWHPDGRRVSFFGVDEKGTAASVDRGARGRRRDAVGAHECGGAANEGDGSLPGELPLGVRRDDPLLRGPHQGDPEPLAGVRRPADPAICVGSGAPHHRARDRLRPGALARRHPAGLRRPGADPSPVVTAVRCRRPPHDRRRAAPRLHRE